MLHSICTVIYGAGRAIASMHCTCLKTALAKGTPPPFPTHACSMSATKGIFTIESVDHQIANVAGCFAKTIKVSEY